MIIYLHGFGGDSKSIKGPILRDGLGIPVYTPSYPSNDIDAAMRIVGDLIDELPSPAHEIMLVGTSMGGFIAQHLGRKYGTKVVLINPALNPTETLSRYIGDNKTFNTGELFTLTAKDVAEFNKYNVTDPQCEFGTLLLLDAADDVIDCKYAHDFYKGSAIIKVFDGGSHKFDHMAEAMPLIEDYYNAIWG